MRCYWTPLPMCEIAAFQQELAAAIDLARYGPLAVYHNTVTDGAASALAANYPVVEAIVGEEMFRAVAIDHCKACPPRSPILATYGARFPDWLEMQSWVRNLPYLADVARVERLYLQSLFAADCQPLQPADLAQVGNWHQLVLRLHPATYFDWFTGPAALIWQEHQAENFSGVEAQWQAEGALFVRPFAEVEMHRIDRGAHRFLFGIRLGETVGAAAIATASLYPETDIGELFGRLVELGCFAARSN